MVFARIGVDMDKNDLFYQKLKKTTSLAQILLNKAPLV